MGWEIMPGLSAHPGLQGSLGPGGMFVRPALGICSPNAQVRDGQVSKHAGSLAKLCNSECVLIVKEENWLSGVCQFQACLRGFFSLL